MFTLETLSNFALEQNCSALLFEVEHLVLDRFLKRSGTSLNTSVGTEIAMKSPIGKW